MRRTAAVLLVLLTASAAWAGLRVNGRDLPREQEVGIYCSVCMGLVFGISLLVTLLMLLFRHLRRNQNQDDD